MTYKLQSVLLAASGNIFSSFYNFFNIT